jgi:glycosyltransferase involved in cell wall biosynthesis
MFCSTIIPSINRPSLSRAVQSVLDQDFAEAYEVIVVNDSGEPLPEMEWQHTDLTRVIDTNRRERSVARNTGAAIARGDYLHFLDDDDTLLPGALKAFWSLAQGNPEAIWLYGSYQTVDNFGNLIDEFHPGLKGNIFAQLISGEAIPFQASLLRARCFYEAGAFDPTLTEAEDRDLGRRMAARGDVAWTPAIVAKIRIGEQGSTTNWQSLAESDRRGREKALNVSGCIMRLWSSRLSSYWHGRVSRAYIASAVWNLNRWKMCVAARRAATGLIMANWRIASPAFWKGLRTKIQ